MREKLIDKVKKLIELRDSAVDCSTEAEVHAISAKIQELMVRHTIAEWEVARDDRKFVRTRAEFEGKVRCAWRELLAYIVGRSFFCRVILISRSANILFYGEREHGESAAATLTYLSSVAEKMADANYVRYFYECLKAGDVKKARGYRRSFLVGFCERLAARLAEEKEALRKSLEASTDEATASGALVLFNDQLAKVSAALEAENSTVKGRRTTVPKLDNSSGYRDGQKTADKIQLGGNARRLE